MSKNRTINERLFIEFDNLLCLRNDCLEIEERLFNAVVAGRRSKVEKTFQKSLQGVLLCLRTSITLMNNELYSGRFRDVKPVSHDTDVD